MAYWAVSRVMFNHERYAMHCLRASGFRIYLPRLRQWRIVRGRRVEVTPALFPGYLFLQITNGWWEARWAPGTLGLIMNGDGPAHVPNAVVEELQMRERGGAIDLVKPSSFRPGDQLRILRGPFCDHLAIYAGMSGSERVAVLLQILGGYQRVTLARRDIEAVS
jgi:transcriptional antiterminator RfaH